MKNSPIRRLRLILRTLSIVLLTLIAHNFYHSWQEKKNGETLVKFCQLPEFPPDVTVHHMHLDSDPTGSKFAIISLSASQKNLDEWLEKIDDWQIQRPAHILSYSVRESITASRIDFTAEIEKN